MNLISPSTQKFHPQFPLSSMRSSIMWRFWASNLRAGHYESSHGNHADDHAFIPQPRSWSPRSNPTVDTYPEIPTVDPTPQPRPSDAHCTATFFFPTLSSPTRSPIALPSQDCETRRGGEPTEGVKQQRTQQPWQRWFLQLQELSRGPAAL